MLGFQRRFKPTESSELNFKLMLLLASTSDNQEHIFANIIENRYAIFSNFIYYAGMQL